jgi:hypothetical protein
MQHNPKQYRSQMQHNTSNMHHNTSVQDRRQKNRTATNAQHNTATTTYEHNELKYQRGNTKHNTM